MLIRVRYIGPVPIALTGEPLWWPGTEREIPIEIARSLLERADFVRVDPRPRRERTR